MMKICLNPFINRNLIDCYAECQFYIQSTQVYKQLLAAQDTGHFVEPFVIWGDVEFVDFLGHKIDFRDRVNILVRLILDLSDDKLEEECKQSKQYDKLGKVLFKWRDGLQTYVKDVINIVDLAYEKTDSFSDVEKVYLGMLANSGYDLVYLFADLSLEDYKKETNMVAKNRQNCFKILDSFLVKERN